MLARGGCPGRGREDKEDEEEQGREGREGSPPRGEPRQCVFVAARGGQRRAVRRWWTGLPVLQGEQDNKI